MILEVYFLKEKEFVAIIAVRGVLCERKKGISFSPRSQRRRDERKDKICSNLYEYGRLIIEKFWCCLRRPKIAWLNGKK